MQFARAACASLPRLDPERRTPLVPVGDRHALRSRSAQRRTAVENLRATPLLRARLPLAVQAWMHYGSQSHTGLAHRGPQNRSETSSSAAQAGAEPSRPAVAWTPQAGGNRSDFDIRRPGEDKLAAGAALVAHGKEFQAKGVQVLVSRQLHTHWEG